MNEEKINEYLLVRIDENFGSDDAVRHSLLELALLYGTYSYSGKTESSYIFYSPCDMLDAFEANLTNSKLPVTIERFTKVDGAPF